MSRSMRKLRKQGDEAFQMAPMIDMVFLLLVFFMTVSTLAKEARPAIDLPVSETAQVPPEAPPREILTIRMEENGCRVFHFNREITLEDLSGLLDLDAAAEPGTEWLLRGSPEVPWRCWKDVLEPLRRAGLENVVFSTFQD